MSRKTVRNKSRQNTYDFDGCLFDTAELKLLIDEAIDRECRIRFQYEEFVLKDTEAVPAPKDFDLAENTKNMLVPSIVNRR